MAHRRSFRGRSTSDSQRRKKSWFTVGGFSEDIAGFTLSPPTLASPGSSLQLLSTDGFGASPSILESTILRIRGFLDIPKSDYDENAANATTVRAFGIGLVTNEAAQSAAVPNPATVLGAEWDGWMFLRSSTQVALDITGTLLDVKAMRKFETGMSLVFVAGAATDLPAGVIPGLYKCNPRLLFLLP